MNMSIELNESSLTDYCISGALCLYLALEREAFKKGTSLVLISLSKILHNDYGLPYFRDEAVTPVWAKSYNVCGESIYSDGIFNNFSRCRNTKCFTTDFEESAGTIAQQMLTLNEVGKFDEAELIFRGLSRIKYDIKQRGQNEVYI